MSVVVDGVRVELGGRAVLDGVGMVAEPGAVTVLVGPNGSGKSTLLAAIAGDVPVAAGSIRICGAEASSLPPSAAARARAVLSQHHGVAFDYPAREVVALGRHAWRGEESAATRDAVALAALADTEAHAYADQGVLSLSGGERSRVQLARVLAQDAPVLLLDEPTAALDLRHQDAALRLARDVAAHGGTVVLVLHDLDAALAIADAVVLLESGRVRRAGHPDDIDEGVLSDVYRHLVEIVEHPRSGRRMVVPLRTGADAPRSRREASDAR